MITRVLRTVWSVLGLAVGAKIADLLRFDTWDAFDSVEGAMPLTRSMPARLGKL